MSDPSAILTGKSATTEDPAITKAKEQAQPVYASQQISDYLMSHPGSTVTQAKEALTSSGATPVGYQTPLAGGGAIVWEVSQSSAPSNPVEDNALKSTQAPVTSTTPTTAKPMGKEFINNRFSSIVLTKAEEPKPYTGPTSPTNQSTYVGNPPTKEPILTQQSTDIVKPDLPKQKEYTAYELTSPGMTTGEKALLNIKTSLTPTPGGILDIIQGKKSPGQVFEERRTQYIEIGEQSTKEQALSQAKAIFLESIPGQIVLWETGSALLSEAGFGIELVGEGGGLLGKTPTITKTKTVPTSDNILVKPRAEVDFTAGKMATETNVYERGLVDLVKKTKTPKSKILTTNYVANLGERGGSLGFPTEISTTGEVRSSGIAVARSVKVAENQAGDFATISKAKYVTKDSSYPGQAITLSKEYVKTAVPGEVVDLDSILRQEGVVTTRGIASAGVEESKGNIGNYIIRSFQPIQEPKIEVSGGTIGGLKPTDLSPIAPNIAKVAESEAVVSSVKNIPTITKAPSGAYFSTVGTIAPKSESPVMTIEEQEYRKKIGSEDIWSHTYNPVFGPDTETATKLKAATKTSLEKGIVTQGRELARDIGHPQRTATSNDVIQGIETGKAIAQDLASELDTKMSTKTITAPMIKNITPQTTEPVSKIPPYVPIPTFALPHRERRMELRRMRFTPSKYSLKIHPTLTAEQVANRGFIVPKGINTDDKRLLKSIKGMKKQSFKKVRF